jgi:hypothetical protein
MNENRMLELADQLKELRDRKSAAQAELKEIGAEIDAVESALIEIMTAEECTGFKRGGSTFSLVIKEYPGAVPECKEQLYAQMKKHGFEHLFTINTQTLSATVKELKANNEDTLPEWLEGLVSIFEQASIRVTKTTK